MLHRLIAVPWYGLAALTGIAAAQPHALTYDSPYAAYRLVVIKRRRGRCDPCNGIWRNCWKS